MMVYWILGLLASSIFCWKWGYNFGKSGGYVRGWNASKIDSEKKWA